MTKWRRRTVLAAAGAGLATLFGAAPGAHAKATLDADLEVTAGILDKDLDLGPDEWTGIFELVFQMESRADQPIEPEPLVWGRNEIQRPWRIIGGPKTLDPGESAEYRIVSPFEEAQLGLGTPAALVVFDRGREARAFESFFPDDIVLNPREEEKDD